MSSSSPVSALEEISSNGVPPQPPTTTEPNQPGDDANKTQRGGIDHIADYAIAINRSLCKSRAPKDRIFQVGGRRRLLYASAAAVQRLRVASTDDPSWPKEVCEILADLAVSIADGVFRSQSHETTARLLTFVIAKLQMYLADTTLLELEKKLRELVGQTANRDIATTLENGFEWRLL
jgi:hypothetical protein